jgi:hypothetical protein
MREPFTRSNIELITGQDHGGERIGESAGRPVEMPMPAGTAKTRPASATTYSCHVPVTPIVMTRCPTVRPSAPLPSSSSTPTDSIPGTVGNSGVNSYLSRMYAGRWHYRHYLSIAGRRPRPCGPNGPRAARRTVPDPQVRRLQREVLCRIAIRPSQQPTDHHRGLCALGAGR